MATVSTQRMTLEQFRALPEGPPYFEFEEGELIPMPSPTFEHQDIVMRLGNRLWEFVRQEKLGRVFMGVDVYLPDGRCFIPDLSFLAADRLHLVSAIDRKIDGSPDLVVEVASSQPERDREHKFAVYYNNGVPWYWIVDQETLAIEEYHATPQGYQLTARVAAGEEFGPQLFAGLRLDLAALVGFTPPPAGST
jgi:Uma2 family endonuclease